MRPLIWLMVGYSSGQRGQTVNLLGKPYTGSNPVPTTISQQGDVLRDKSKPKEQRLPNRMRTCKVRRSEAEMGHTKHESKGLGAKRKPILFRDMANEFPTGYAHLLPKDRYMMRSAGLIKDKAISARRPIACKRAPTLSERQPEPPPQNARHAFSF